MKIKNYAIKDALVGFKPLFQAPNDNYAERMLAQLVNDVNANDIKNSPKDYALYYMGEMDDQTGEFVSCVTFLANAVDFIRLADIAKKDVFNENEIKEEDNGVC